MIRLTKHTLIIDDSSFMPEVESGSIQFVVTSPPYWNLKKYGDNGLSSKQAYSKYLYQIKVFLRKSEE